MLRLGLDIGTNSIGWCLIEYDEARKDGYAIRDIGVRIFSDGRDPKSGASLAVDRRAARAMRRRRDRYLRRRSAFLEALIRFGLMPADTDEAKLIAERDPYEYRKKALEGALQPYEIGRALFHLNQRRGFLSNRKTERRQKPGEEGKIKQGEYTLDSEMIDAGAETLGQFLAGRDTKRVRQNSDNQLYDFYPQRRHIQYEFQRIWDAQAAHYPELMTSSRLSWDELDRAIADPDCEPLAEARDALYRILFFQRPLKETKVGLCLFAGRYGIPRDEQRLPKAHPLFQELRLYQEVNQLAITTPGEAPRPLNREQRDDLVLALRTRAKASFSILAKTLKLQPDESFNKASATRTDLIGNEVYHAMADKKRFGNRWAHLSMDEQWTILKRLIDEENPEKLHAWLVDEWALDEEAAQATAKVRPPEGHGRIGAAASRLILEQLKDDVIPYSKAVEKCGWNHSDDRTGEILAKLPYYGELLSREIPPGTFDPADADQPEVYWGKITNPTVHIGLRQLEKLINAVIAVHGRPHQIVVELARELNLNEKDKEEHERRIRKDTADAQRRSQTLLGIDKDGNRIGEKIADDTGANRALLKLWEELAPSSFLDRCCPYCGKAINITTLFSAAVQIDHILPYSQTWDDSAANKVVAHRHCNQEKANRAPYKAWGHDPERWNAITAQVRHLKKAKQWRFEPDALDRFKDQGGFIARQLKDTQYLSRLAGKYLGSLYADKDEGNVYVIPGRMTAMLRRLWGLNSILRDHNYVDNAQSNAPKNRLDHRHHPIDAAVTAVTTRSLLQRIAHTAGRAEEKNIDRLFEDLDQPWEGFREELQERLDRVVVSHKADHGRQRRPVKDHDSTSARLHDETAYGIVGEFQPGKAPIVVKRVPFMSLEAKDIAAADRIRDPALRTALRDAAGGLSGAALLARLKHFREHHPHFKGIRHVRVIGESAGMPTLNVIPMKDETGRIYKAYKGNANAFFTVWEMPNGKWVHDVVTVFDHHQKDFEQLRPHPAARKVLALRQNDLIAIERDGGPRQIMRVQKYGQNGQIFLIEHNETGNMSERNKSPNDPFKMWGPAAGSLKALKARQIRIDPLGRVFDPGPRA